MPGFDGIIGRAAVVVGVAATVAAAVARPAGARVAPPPRQQAEAKPAEKVAPAPAAVLIEKVEVKVAVGAQVVVDRQVAVGKVAAVPGPAPAPGPAEAPDFDPAAQARLHQLKPILRDELRVLTVAVAPTPEQRRAIALAGGRKLREIARTPEERRPRVNLFGKRIIPNDPAKMVHEAVEAAARAVLAPGQVERLQAEARARAEDRREAVLMAVVAKLDRTLDLGGDQRERILADLRAGYDEATYPTLALLAAFDGYLPAIPDRPIVAHLAPAQRVVWADAQKLDFRSINIFEDGEDDAPGAADPDLEAALAGESKP